jgi:hypothetical protein
MIKAPTADTVLVPGAENVPDSSIKMCIATQERFSTDVHAPARYAGKRQRRQGWFRKPAALCFRHQPVSPPRPCVFPAPPLSDTGQRLRRISGRDRRSENIFVHQLLPRIATQRWTQPPHSIDLSTVFVPSGFFDLLKTEEVPENKGPFRFLMDETKGPPKPAGP